MKLISDIKVIDREQRKRDKIQAIQLMITQQIEVLEKLFENHSDLVVNPYAYNACVGLLAQLRLHGFGCFVDSHGSAPQIPDGNSVPYFHIRHGE